ncbi:MAG: hypothetical protein K2Q03_08285 [Sphingobacteriaceae bacterium]|nr:hypothetical protein [Sphingobacteriaceae bacterium]
MKKLVSLMMDAPEIKKIKALENISFAEFVRSAVREYLRGFPNNVKEVPQKPLATFLYYLQNDINLSINDYYQIFTCLHTEYRELYQGHLISEKESTNMAFIVCELLMLEFSSGDISDHSASYFTNSIVPINNYKEDIEKLKAFNFSQYFIYLHYEKNIEKFNTLELIKIISVFIRKYLSLENQPTAISLLMKINPILLKLIKYITSEQTSQLYQDQQLLIKDIYKPTVENANSNSVKPFIYFDKDFWLQVNISNSKWQDGSYIYVSFEIKKTENILYMGMHTWLKFIDTIKNKTPGFYLECNDKLLGLIKTNPISMNVTIDHDLLRAFISKIETETIYNEFVDLSYRM